MSCTSVACLHLFPIYANEPINCFFISHLIWLLCPPETVFVIRFVWIFFLILSYSKHWPFININIHFHKIIIKKNQIKHELRARVIIDILIVSILYVVKLHIPTNKRGKEEMNTFLNKDRTRFLFENCVAAKYCITSIQYMILISTAAHYWCT